ncbi:MAG: Cu(I)/Ag(I) efflux system membrane protein CusA/SilA [Flavobacteriales bacterium]|jgi:Cu(I)/Ag(I) efflux system membrane protein CusA/SilA
MLNRIIKFFLENKLVAWLLLGLFIIWGLVTAPFNIESNWIPRDPVAVDAIPDIGENQQIVFTKWMGRSPQDVEDQITYPLTSSLLGIPGVKSVRSNSMFGFSSIYLIFEEDIEFYWSRSRILEKLNSLPANLLPDDVQPTLGPDATALGQIYWYTLEGKDKEGNTTGGWDLHELRTVQDFYVKNALQSSGGVSEVASIGGFVKEYQVDVNPDKMKLYGVTLNEVMKATKESNLDIGAQTLEINMAEYFVRGLGYVNSIEDIEQSVVKMTNNIPIRIKDIAVVHLGPATRRGILDKGGAPAVGGVVVARYGSNPLEIINNVKKKIEEIKGGLPVKTLSDGTVSQVTIVPFYDRTQLINETIGTLEEALTLEVLITIIVVILMLLNLKSSLLISASLPVAVFMCFIAMRYFGIDANIVALSGIAIAVGTMVDMGIVLTESMISQMKIAPPEQSIQTTIYIATIDVASAVVTAVATTIVSFLPVFTMQASEGKLFRPLAYTKSFALIASIILAITVIPALAVQLFKFKSQGKMSSYFSNGGLVLFSIILLFTSYSFFGFFGLIVGLGGIIHSYYKDQKSEKWIIRFDYIRNIIYALLVAWLLAKTWMPLGVMKSELTNFIFVISIIGSLIGFFYMVIHFYEKILRFLIEIKYVFIGLLVLLLFAGYSVFKNTGQEFMPSLNEGSFLLMPTAMPHAGMEMNEANLRLLDMSVSSIPEVDMVVGKAGRIESSLDPAPMSMYENIISYKSEYKLNEEGHRVRFKVNEKGEFYLDLYIEEINIEFEGTSMPSQKITGFDAENGFNVCFNPETNEYSFKNGNEISSTFQKGIDEYVKKKRGDFLIEDDNGKYFRQWRDHIKSPDDIWTEIVNATKLPGLTSAPKLQPIETRLVMLQTGMRAPMGIKVKGSDLKTIEAFGLQLEMFLKEVKGVKTSAVFAERIVGKPYLMLDIKRDIISKYGLSVVDVQNQIQTAIGVWL